MAKNYLGQLSCGEEGGSEKSKQKCKCTSLHGPHLILGPLNQKLTVQSLPTSFSGVNTEALVPEAADQDVAVVGSNHKTVCVDLDALVHQVSDLTLVHA